MKGSDVGPWKYPSVFWEGLDHRLKQMAVCLVRQLFVVDLGPLRSRAFSDLHPVELVSLVPLSLPSFLEGSDLVTCRVFPSWGQGSVFLMQVVPLKDEVLKIGPTWISLLPVL